MHAVSIKALILLSNEDGAAFAISLWPQFYQTYWFYALCVLAAALIGGGIYLLRIRQVKAHERELVLLVSERTQELKQEIAERERVEETLRESEAVFRSLTETVAAAIYIYRDSKYIYLNPATEIISGYTREELMEREVWDIVHPDFRQQIKARAALRQKGEDVPQHSEIKILTKHGEERWLDLTASRIQFQGQPALLATAFDITERKQAEESLRQSEERYRTIIEEMTDSFWELDLAGHFTFFNHQVVIEQGRSREELLTLNRNRYRPHIDEANYKIAAESFAQIYRTGEPMRGLTYEMIRGDGARYTIETSLSLIRDSDGQPAGFRGISRDVTERQQAAKELQQAKEAAEAASRAKSEFLANMSHEIRTPMNGIIGMTELALETHLTTEQSEYLGMVKASANALLTIINDILDFSKIEAGKLTLDLTDFRLRQSLNDTIKPLRLRAQQKGLKLDCHVSPEVPEELVGDAGRVRQILINLIGNAIKFTEQGQITVRVELESRSENCGLENADPGVSAEVLQSAIRNLQSTIRNPQSPIFLRFTVSDTGVGIPSEKQRLIFEAFLQADGSTTRQYGGTGLGLTISSRLVEMMEGQIGVESTVGEGSTFHFTAQFGRSISSMADQAPSRQTPLPAADHAPLRARQELPKSQRGLQILLAEDNLVNQKLAVHLLEKHGHQVTVADTGREALAAIERQPFDLILMDVQMPEMDGIEATMTLRRQEQATGAHLPIIAMTAHAMKGDRERCLEAGMDGYVSKPIQPTELFKVMAELVPAEATAAAPSPAREPQAVVFNRAAALEQVEGDEELLAELAGLFMGDSARLLGEMQQAIAREESKRLERAAHTLKGAAGNFGAQGVVSAAEELEEMGRTGKLAKAEAAYHGLEAEMKRLNEAIGALCSQSPG